MDFDFILNVDCIEGLQGLESNSIDCCVSSPPYWSLRDYGVENQLGLEDTPEEFIQSMARVFDEVQRVLKPEGTLWLNIGDTYWNGKGRSGSDANLERKTINKAASKIGGKGKLLPKDRSHPIIKRKETVGTPWMLAFELRRRGWYIRQDIIWNKTNPMPESVKDRCTKSHEYIFLLTKSQRYYYDAYAIATPYKEKTLTTHGCGVNLSGDRSGLVKSENWHKTVPERKPKVWNSPSANGEGKANKKSVWEVATKPFKEAHFATFPEKLIVDCIKAGCPAGGIVLDPFMGAGTTALVARKLNRHYIGFELNPEYVAIAETRLKKTLGLFV